MARDVFVAGRRLRVESTDILGEGGEAEVFDLRSQLNQEIALKLWRAPEDPYYEGDEEKHRRNRAAAKARLEEAGAKLLAFPKGLPDRIISPIELARNRADKVIGYTMRLLGGTLQLRELALRKIREASGISQATVVRTFMDLHPTVSRLHPLGVTIGDFNYMNVLVRLGATIPETYLIDADSMQYGIWVCRGFTPRFVDPLICELSSKELVQVKPHSPETDWYAYSLMLFECLMYIHLYGGTYSPKDKSKIVGPNGRPLKGVSVFTPEVIYPKAAIPLSWLPNKVVDYYGALTSMPKPKRDPFPFELLEILLAHAEGRYADPAKAITPAMLREVIRGKVKSRKVFDMSNEAIVRATFQNRTLQVLFHHGGELKRESGQSVMRTPLSPALHYRLQGRRTIIAMGNKLAVFDPLTNAPEMLPVDQYQGRFPVADANAHSYYWLDDGKLYRSDTLGRRLMGSVLRNQTLFWVGPTFGFGFYRAISDTGGRSGGFTIGFVFNATVSGINDRVPLPPIKGELLDAVTYFSSNRAWFCYTTRESGKILNHCIVIRPDGSVSNEHRAEDSDGSWLSSIHGKCAATVQNTKAEITHRLYAATDNGLVAVDEVSGNLLETTQYPDTADFVDPSNALFYDYAGGVFAVSRREIWQVTFA